VREIRDTSAILLVHLDSGVDGPSEETTCDSFS
jgi:hypothetical protein